MKYILLISFYLFNLPNQAKSTNEEHHSQLTILNDKTFDTVVNLNSSAKWIILFYVKSCMYCSSLIQLVEKEIMPEYLNDKSTLFASVECNENVWLAARFNITKIPYTILIENNKMFEYKSLDSKERFLHFVNKEKVIEDSLPIPVPVSNYNMMIIIATGLFNHVNEVMQGYLQKYNITSIQWNSYMTAGLSVMMLIGLITIQYLVFKCINLFGLNKNKNIKIKTYKGHDNAHSKKD